MTPAVPVNCRTFVLDDFDADYDDLASEFNGDNANAERLACAGPICASDRTCLELPAANDYRLLLADCFLRFVGPALHRDKMKVPRCDGGGE